MLVCHCKKAEGGKEKAGFYSFRYEKKHVMLVRMMPDIYFRVRSYKLAVIVGNEGEYHSRYVQLHLLHII